VYRSLHSGFLRSSAHYPDRPAAEVGGQVLSYGELRSRAAALAATLQQNSPQDGSSLTAVFTHRSPTAFVGVLAALFRGHGYVPLNRTFSVDRTRTMLFRSDCSEVIVDHDSATQIEEVLQGIGKRLLVLMPDHMDVKEFREKLPGHTILGANDLAPAESWEAGSVSPDSIAYLLFTSGSTGIPKGVVVAQRNVRHFVEVMVNRYGVTEHDRFSQTFDMTFDLSAFDMFVAWERGACVCCPTSKVLISPGRFIQDSRLTVWFSVPSVGAFMKRLGMLKPNRYPSLRWSLFCGEALPVEVAQDWTAAAPNSILENLYGPTELTIACTLYRWDPNKSPAECKFGTVPIGKPYPGMHAIVVDDGLKEVAPGEEGELLLTGPQLSLGYWQDPEKTVAAFVTPAGQKDTYYRTGDRVRRPITHEEPISYLGRIDHQVKVLGHRLELGEVEAVLRREPGVETAVALGWPLTTSGASGVVAFVTGTRVEGDVIRTSLQGKLPSYAVPREVRVMSQLPLNVNGKVDRKALRSILEVSA
jgi:amino acid adenylation domain-containing protein